jgi:hypothetical protein
LERAPLRQPTPVDEPEGATDAAAQKNISTKEFFDVCIRQASRPVSKGQTETTLQP